MTDWREIAQWLSHPVTAKLVSVLAGVATVLVVAMVARRAIRGLITDSSVAYRARKIVDLASYVLVLIVVLTTLSNQLTGLTVFMGGISVGVGLALQEVVISFAGWLAISAGGFFRVGDRVQLGGIIGDVIDIGLLRTTLMECGGWVRGDLYNGRIVRIANSFVFREPVFNYSGEFPFLWDEIVVPVKYGSDRELARELLVRVAAEVTGAEAAGAAARWKELVRSYRIEEARLESLVTLVANDNWLEYTVRYVTDHRARRITKDHLFERILAEIDATNGRVALASATVQLVELPHLDVRLSNTERERG